MKVCGFTVIKNGMTLGYPFKEAILSVLPICDQLVVAVGDCEDNTREVIENIPSDKIVILDTIWDASLLEGGKVLAEETNKAFDAIGQDFDWCFYIQGDEVVHEKDHPSIQKAMRENLTNKKVDGLLFNYVHFYATFDYIGDSRKWYRREIRIIRNIKKIRSYRDAQGFRFENDEKLNVKLIDASIYHYGWVRPPVVMKRKQDQWKSLYSIPVDKTTNTFDYETEYDSLKKFQGSHPKVMQKHIAALNWNPVIDLSKRNFSLKRKFHYHFEKMTGIRLFEYRNYNLLK